MNVLNALPQSVQAKAKGHLHDICQAETRAEAGTAFDVFVKTCGVKWDKALDKLVKDRDALLTICDFPVEHWKHIRTSNPIESTFATVRHRTKRTRGCLSRKTGLAMAFKLMMAAQVKWRKIDGQNRLWAAVVNIDVRGRSYAPKGETPVARAPASRQKLSMISTVSNQGKARFMIIDDTFGSGRLIEFPKSGFTRP